MEVDFKEFFAAVDKYADETEKSSVDSLNRAMAGVVYRSRNSVIRKTPKTTKAKILRSLSRRGDMFERIAAKSLRKKGQKATPTAIAAEMKRIYNRRVSSISYVKSGWSRAARVFGASRIKPAISGTVAARGEGKAATRKRLEAYALNAVGANLKEGEVRRKSYAAVQQSVNAQTADMLKYLTDRLKKTNQKHGGR